MSETLPDHIGYIVDGNRRWAKARGLSSKDGHFAGFQAFNEIAEATFKNGVKYVSAYIFSTENWNRTAEEVGYLMKLFENYFAKEVKKLHDKDIRVLFLGDRKYKVSQKLVDLMEQGEKLTENNSAGTLCLCFNYGGQMEIADATKKIVQKALDGEISVDKIDINTVSQNIYHPEVPPLDLMVRTSGEQRISNFQLWRIAYSEMIFLDKAFPDMVAEDVSEILEIYKNRERRMGGDSKK